MSQFNSFDERDYKKESCPLSADRTLKIHLAQGGGYVAIISPAKI